MSKFRVCIAGGRDFKEEWVLFTLCDAALANKHPDIVIVSGVAWGADAAGINYAKTRGYEIDAFPVMGDQWEMGKHMGHVRNAYMLNSCDALIAFWDGKSSGTNEAIKYAKRRGMLVKVYNYVGDGLKHIAPDWTYRSEQFRKHYEKDFLWKKSK